MSSNMMAANGEHCSVHDNVIEWFEEATEHAPAKQTETLRRILELNWGVEYLKKWLGDLDVREMGDKASTGAGLESLYTSLVPLATHADFEPYINRIADGETKPLITQQPITTLSLSSGTTEGRQKLVPFTQHSSQTTIQTFKIAAAYRSRVYPTREGRRTLDFIYSGKRFKTKGGVTAGLATTHVYASEEFKAKQKESTTYTCSPEPVISNGDYKQSTYCHLLLGLHFSDQVEFITSTFAYSVVQAFTSFEETWKEICNDIRECELSASRITIPNVREAVLNILTGPNASLASEVQSKCEELEGLDWHGVIPKLWPNAKYVCSILTGSMQPYLGKLRHYAGNLPLVSADYGSTESWIGVNVDAALPPESVTFAVVPTFSYFEFIPLHRRENQQGDDFVEDDPVPLSQVKIGQEYEVVLTTFTGLYRYRLGDVVEVAGFHRNTPKLSYVCRRKLILTVNVDKNTEKDLQSVVEKGSHILMRKSRGELVDFTSHADVAKQPGHYVIYWEIKGEVEERVLGECCSEMDASFVDHGYVVSRRTNSIGPLELCIVERGTFKKIMEYFLANGAAFGQFKTPRCTTNPVLLRILNLCTIKRFHSTAYGP